MLASFRPGILAAVAVAMMLTGAVLSCHATRRLDVVPTPAPSPQIADSTWVRGQAPTPQALSLLAALRHVEDSGLSPGDFAAAIRQIELSLQPLDAARLDAALTAAAARLVTQLHDGRADPALAGYALHQRRRPLDVGSTLRTLAASADVDATLAALEPRATQYLALKQLLARYRHSPDAAALADPALARHIRQVELTLERWRWLPDLHAPAVIVNVPQYMLYTLPWPGASGAVPQPSRIPVIVGKLDKQTPVFDSAIESVVFRPYWDVPRGIAVDELLPLIERDSGYLAAHEMEIVRGSGDTATVLPGDAAGIGALRAGRARLRQRPGRQNALGLIKFVLPNPYAVYLHSTPQPGLFARESRALSHGCIRVSDAAALAAYLLKDTPGDWSPDAIEAATCAEVTRTVKLAKPVPVYILYGTVVMDDGQPLFFDDIYGYDARLEALLAQAADASINAPR